MPGEETAAQDGAGAGRLRIALRIIIVLLLLGTGALTYFFVRMLQPEGAPKAAAVPTGLTWVRSLYGFGPAKDEQLQNPTSVAIAPDGDIYATDPERARVMRFAPGGAFKSLVHTGRGGTETGKFIRPESIAVDGDGDLYIADSIANKVIVFDDAGRYVREWKTARPTGISVRDDHVYVLSPGTLTVFDRAGAKLGSFGKRGPAPGEIDAYQGVVGDGRDVYVADALNQRVEAFDQKGDAVWVAPDLRPAQLLRSRTATSTPKTDAATADTFELPQDLVFDGAGRLVVVDAFKFQLIVVSPKDGHVIARYGDYGESDGSFFYPTGIDYDPARDWFAVADTRNDRVQIVRIPGSGGSRQADAMRLLTSPYRYCAPSLLLAVLAVIVAVVTGRRGRRREKAAL